MCNRAKNTLSLNEFVEWAVRLGRRMLQIKLLSIGKSIGLSKGLNIDINQEKILHKYEN